MKDQAEEEKNNSQEIPGTHDQVVELAENENTGQGILKGHNSKRKSNRFSPLQETKLPPTQCGRRATEK